MWEVNNLQLMEEDEEPLFLRTFETNDILFYWVFLTGIYEMMYRSICILFWGMWEFTWSLNINFFTLNVMM